MRPSKKSTLVAVVGGSGAGKGWIVERLSRLFPGHSCTLSLDNFYKDRSHLPPGRRARLNFDRPAAIDWALTEKALRACRNGQPAQIPRYDFATHTNGGRYEAFDPKPIVFVEGLWLLVHPAIRRQFDLTLYLDCPARLRLQRRLARDRAERGRSARSILQQYRSSVAPMHLRHVEPQKTKADLVLTQPYLFNDIRRVWETLSEISGYAPSIDSWRIGELHTEWAGLVIGEKAALPQVSLRAAG